MMIKIDKSRAAIPIASKLILIIFSLWKIKQ